MTRILRRWIAAPSLKFSAILLFLAYSPAFAFNSLTHSQVTHSAFHYLENYSRLSPASGIWLGGTEAEKHLTKQLLIRAIVDADFRPDLWITGALHTNVAGGTSDSGVSIFTTLFHHLNVVDQGTFWENDGYAYRHTSGTGNDSLLATFSARIVGAVSPALGGHNVEHPSHGFTLPPYKLGFRGTNSDWNVFFFGNNDPTNAVFPPASVPSELSYRTLISSDRAAKTFLDSWSERLPLISGPLSERTLSRYYWRAEVMGRPRALDVFGLALHMIQDMGMPHHTQGIASYCHPEMELYLDQLICNGGQGIPLSDYERGTFLEDFNRCQTFYDPALIASLIASLPALQVTKPKGITQRMTEIAKISARWRWGTTSEKDDSVTSVFPDGSYLTVRDCSGFIGNRAIQAQLKFQYNLAVASSVVFMELASREYESFKHISAAPTLGNGLPFYMTPQAGLAPLAPFMNKNGGVRVNTPF